LSGNSGSLNLLDPHQPAQACFGIALLADSSIKMQKITFAAKCQFVETLQFVILKDL
jgi:hypothetical protein